MYLHQIKTLLALFVCFFALYSCKKAETPQNERVAMAQKTGESTLNLATIGAAVQEFEEKKSAAVENTRLALGSYWTDFEPTGFYLAPNTTLQLDVQQVTGNSLPKLLIGTYSRYVNKWNPQEVQLTTGTNTITADQFGGLIWIRYGTSGAPASKAKITFVSGAVRSPVYIKGQTTLSDWANQLNTYTNAPDVVLVGDRVYFVYARSRAIDTKTQDNNYVLEKADQTMNVEDDLSGLDGSAPQHQPNANTRLLLTETDNSDYWMVATYYRTAYYTDAAPYAFTPLIGSVDGWGPWHELGHMHQQQAWKWSTLGEVTVNIYSLAVERAMGVTPSRLKRDNVWPTALSYLADTSVNKDFNDSSMPNGVWVRLCMFHQLWLAYGDSFYKQLHKQTRIELPSVSTDAEKMRYFMLKACAISGENLSSFFRKWGFKVDESVYAEMANLGLPVPATDPSTLSE
ncbi:M60 family metallopeptidase [Olivibacter sp. CPCC 100613]|uniref:M60 family metallopeptidase n=1 Tax=Olivibacter sp. CPCC 100613 TaxID=3079931 RepID=UPI002FFB7F6B